MFSDIARRPFVGYASAMSAQLLYIARWLKNGAVMAERRYGSLQEAKENARRQLPIHHLRQGANSAEVLDDQGKLYLRVY